MPTGYTAALYDGEQQTLAEFARSAARGMGAFMHMRDAGFDAPLRYPADDTPRCLESYKESLRKLSEWDFMSEDQKYSKWSVYVEDTENYVDTNGAEREARKANYERVLNEVKSKDVPEVLATFKQFMISQLEESINFDCSSYKPSVVGYSAWCDQQDDYLRRRVELDREYVIKANERYREVCAYIDALSETFGFEVEKRGETQG